MELAPATSGKRWSVLARLMGMMFLQYAIWGAWTTVLGETLMNDLGLTGQQTGWIYAALWAACIVVPFIGGQIVDRYMPTQWFLAAAHLLGGAALIVMSLKTQVRPMLWWMVLHSIFYAPTLALTNSLAFSHLKDTEKEFGWVRVFGTVGWIVAGWGLTWWRLANPGDATAGNYGGLLGGIDSLQLAGVLAVAMGLYCVFLPNTPPKREGVNPFAFLEAGKLFKAVKGFLPFMLISFVVTTELQFYYISSAPFLKDVGVPRAWLGTVKTIAQLAEIVCMAALLPIFLKKFKMRTVLAIGVIAWPLRYIVFAVGKPLWLVAASLALHGVGYTFFFVVSQIYVDKVAPKDIRGSAQSLLTLVTLGFGNLLGTFFTGWIMDMFSRGGAFFDFAARYLPVIHGKGAAGIDKVWAAIFILPCILTVTCAILFLIFFVEPKEEGKPARTQQE